MAPRFFTSSSGDWSEDLIAWSSSEARVPAHCCSTLKRRLTSVGECRGVGLPSKRRENCRGSPHPWLGSWQLTHATVPLRGQRCQDRHGSRPPRPGGIV